MDSLLATIAQLRAALASATALMAQVETLASAVLVDKAPVAAALPPTKSTQSSSAAAAGPVMVYPTLEVPGAHLDFEEVADAAQLGPKAQRYREKLKAIEDEYDRYSLEQVYCGTKITLYNVPEHERRPYGRDVLVWAFHAFALPEDGSYQTPQPLVHLGLYNIKDDSLDTSEAPPALPRNPAYWPWP